jgi:hypothetical protein
MGRLAARGYLSCALSCSRVQVVSPTSQGKAAQLDAVGPILEGANG